MTMTRNKLIAWVIAFLMAFTVFGVLGVSQVNAADNNAALTVKVVGMDNTEEVIATYTADDISKMATTDFYPYVFTGKSGVEVFAAAGIRVNDFIPVGYDMSQISGLKACSGDFAPNDNQIDYLTNGVTYTEATVDETGALTIPNETSVDVPFIIGTQVYFIKDNGITLGGETDTVAKAFAALKAKIDDKSAVAGKPMYAAPGSLNTGDIRGNKFVKSVDTIKLFKGEKQNLTIQNAKATIKAKKLKKAAYEVPSPITVSSDKIAEPVVTYTKGKVNKSAKNFTVDKTTGTVTVKKGTKKGKYTVNVKVDVAGDLQVFPAAGNAKVVIIIK